MQFKAKVLAKLIEKLNEEMEMALRAANEAREAATHEESVAEDKYDTRGLEASYLAGGQGRRAAELSLIIEALQSLKLKEFSKNDAVQLTALIKVETNQKQALFFICGKGGGTKFEVDGYKIQVVTPESPLGRADYQVLLGLIENYARNINSLFTQYKPHDDRHPLPERQNALFSGFYVLKNFMIMLYPFVPSTMDKLRETLNLPPTVFDVNELGTALPAGHSIGAQQTYFPAVP